MEYTVRLVGRYWHVVKIVGIDDEKVLSIHFGTKAEAEAVAKHLQHAKRPGGQQINRADLIN